MTEQEILNLINLLRTGRWNLSLDESENVIRPLITKLGEMLNELKGRTKDN